jgi:hypothetical protein
MKRKDCEGCETISYGDLCPYFDKNLMCPCSICLVKSMCIDSCDLLEEHRKRIEEMT